jgi:isoleucyl-tRNA synthetase
MYFIWSTVTLHTKCTSVNFCNPIKLQKIAKDCKNAGCLLPFMFKHWWCFFFKDQSKEPAYGADVLRFWSAQAQLQKSVMVGPSILKKCNEELFKVL